MYSKTYLNNILCLLLHVLVIRKCCFHYKVSQAISELLYWSANLHLLCFDRLTYGHTTHNNAKKLHIFRRLADAENKTSESLTQSPRKHQPLCCVKERDMIRFSLDTLDKEIGIRRKRGTRISSTCRLTVKKTDTWCAYITSSCKRFKTVWILSFLDS